jgi:hypothetical protein
MAGVGWDGGGGGGGGGGATGTEISVGASDGGAAIGGLRTAINPEQTEQRARTPCSGTLAGSTRNTVAHCGQVTFIGSSTAAGVASAGAAPDLHVSPAAVNDK